MGASPHTPLLFYYNGIVREEGLCGRQEMCEHLLPEKLIFSGADRAGRFRIPINRVCPRRDARLSSPPCPVMGYGAGTPCSLIALDLGYAGGKKRESIRLLTS